MPTNYCKNSYFYNMIFETESKYWLASRYCGCNSSYSNYGMRLIRNSDVHGYYFYRSDDAVEGTDCSLRPVVSLGSNIKIIQFNGETSKTDTKQMHSLSK